jgi:hypothetical protein
MDPKNRANAGHYRARFVVPETSQQIRVLGCGGGNLATRLSRLGKRLTIVDINPISFVLSHKFSTRHLRSFATSRNSMSARLATANTPAHPFGASDSLLGSE